MTLKLQTILLALSLLGAAINGCRGSPEEGRSWAAQRSELVRLLKHEGIGDSSVLDAIGRVLRHEFVPSAWRPFSYANQPLPIGCGQTISQPYIVAFMCEALRLTPKDTVLEIGTGSGYHAAVMSLLASYVYTIEIIPELGQGAEQKLKELGYDNVAVRIGDGYQGWPDRAPFDAIILTAAPLEVPHPLLEQLKIGGRLVAPVGESWQELVLIERSDTGYKRTRLLPVRFVPMTGEAQQEGRR